MEHDGFYGDFEYIPSLETSEPEKKEFAQEYRKTNRRVPGLLGAIWKELLEPNGVTLHVDLRDQDFAKIFPYYSYHITKGRDRPRSFGYRLFQSTMFKGYNIYYPSFGHLVEAINGNAEICTKKITL
jgi:hypothetical protein